MSLAELTSGVTQLEGVQARLLVLDVGESAAAKVELRQLTAGDGAERVLAAFRPGRWWTRRR